MRHSKDENVIGHFLIHNEVGKSPEGVASPTCLRDWPSLWRLYNSIQRTLNFGDESSRGFRTAFAVPQQCAIRFG
jgi:hypothetical protein